MDEQLGLLIELQEIDRRIRGLSDQKDRLPVVLAEIEERRAAGKADLESVKERLAAAQKAKRDRDADLEQEAQKVQKLKARTTDIKTNKEYQALLKEIETAEQGNKAIEDEILVLMEKIDAAAAEIKNAEQRTRDAEAALAAEQKQHEEEFAAIDKELAAVEQERAGVIGRVQPGILRQYQNLLATKGGIAMAEARGEACSGCYMSIPPQVFVNVKKNASIITCPQCNRILYYKEVIAPDAEAQPAGRPNGQAAE